MNEAVYTVGHSTRGIEEVVDLLRDNGVRLLVDVRRFPASRRYPHFTGPALAGALARAGVAYRHEADLGGHREPRPDSPNRALRSPSFRGYADHGPARHQRVVLVVGAERRADGIPPP